MSFAPPDGFWLPKWSQVGTKMGSKINVNFERRFFKKLYFSERKTMFLRSSRSKLGANIDQTSIKKRSPGWDASWHRFFIDFGWFWEPCWEAKSNKNQSNTVSEKRLKKEEQQDGQQDAPRAYGGARTFPPLAQGGVPPLRRDGPLGPTQIRASRILASKVLYNPLEYLKVL